MNKKAQTVFTIFFWLLIFGIVFVMALGPQLADIGARAVIDNDLTGVEAFIMDNLVVIVIFVLLIAMFAMMKLGVAS